MDVSFSLEREEFAEGAAFERVAPCQYSLVESVSALVRSLVELDTSQMAHMFH